MKRPSYTRPKRVLRLPDLDHAKAAVLNTLSSPDSQRSYRFAINDFIAWYCSEPRLAFNKTVVLRYRLQLEARCLASSTINLRLAAVRRLAYEAADTGLLSPELAAGIRRVKGAKKLGIRLGNGLSPDQAKRLLRSPNVETVRGKRDRAMLASHSGAGCAAWNWYSSRSSACSAGKTTGSSSIWSGKGDTSERFLFRTGSKRPSICGPWRQESPGEESFAV